MYNQLGQYTSSPGHRVYRYTELASLTVVASTQFPSSAYPPRDGHAELAWAAGLLARSHPTTNQSQGRISLLIKTEIDTEATILMTCI